MSDTNIFELLNNAEEFVKSQREQLSDEDKKEFDKKLEESDFFNLKSNFQKELNGIGSQMSKLFNK
jgi:hypothetical protein